MRIAHPSYIISIFCLIVLALPVSHAFTMTLNNDTLKIPTGTSNKFVVSFRSDTDEKLTLSLLGEKSWTILKDIQPQLVAGQEKTLDVVIEPPPSLPTGLYRFVLFAVSITTGEKRQQDLYVSVAKGEGISIDSVRITGDLYPTGKISIKTNLMNYGDVTVPNSELETVVAGQKGNIFLKTTIIERLDPEITEISQDFMVPETTPAGNYNVITTFKYGDKITTWNREFTIIEKAIIVKEEKIVPNILGYEKRITVRNVGNILGQTQIMESLPRQDSVFFTSQPEPQGSGGIYQWTSDLMPGSAYTVIYKVDYLPLVMIIIVLAIFCWYVFYKLRTIRVMKSVLQKIMVKEGEEFTIAVTIKNSSGKNVSDVTVKDTVPPIFKIVATPGLAPLKRKTSTYTQLVWRLKDVKKGEERIFSYKIVPVVGVHGHMKLPVATVKFKRGNRFVEHKSNKGHLGV